MAIANEEDDEGRTLDQRMELLRDWSKTLTAIDIEGLLEFGVPPRLLAGGVLDVDGLVEFGWSVLGGIAPPDVEADEPD